MASLLAMMLMFIGLPSLSGADNFLITAVSPQTAGAPFTITVTAQTGMATDTAYVGTVTFSSSDPLAVLPADYTFLAGDNGSRQFTLVELRTAGLQTITVEDAGTPSITGNTGDITVAPAAAVTLEVGGFADPVTAGVSDDVTVTARDAFGNTATGYGGTVAITSSDGAAVLPIAATLTAGTGTFSVQLRTAPGPWVITATDTVTASITGNQSGIDVAPASAVTLTVGGFADPVTAGVSGNVTVTAHDAFGNTATGYAGTVAITSSDSAAVLPGSATLTSGTGAFSVELRTAPGPWAITATDTVTTTITGTQSGIDVTPAAANRLAIGQMPTSAIADTPFSPQPVIHIRDAFGNLVDDDTTTVTAALTTGTSGQFRGTKTVTASNGVATFTNLEHDRAENIVIAFTSTPSLIGVSSPTIGVGSGVAATLQVSGFPSSQVAGTATSVTVTALDSVGNTAIGYTGTVRFTSNDPQAVLPADYTFVAGDAGTKTFTSAAQLRTVGAGSITATDTVTASITGTQSGITVTPGTAVQLVFTTQPAAATAGAAFATQPVVRTRDAYGNLSTVGLAASVPLSMTLSAGSGSLTGTTTIDVGTSGTPGIATFSTLRIDDASDAKTITASATLDGSLRSVASSSFAVSPAAAHHLAMQVQPPASVTAGATFSPSPVVVIRDQFNNVRSSDTLTITAARSGGSGTLQGTTAVAAVAGAATFNALSHPVANDITIQFTSGALQPVTSSTVAVTAGGAAALRITGGASQVAGAANPITITAIDSLGNTVSGYAGSVALTFAGGSPSTNPVTVATVEDASAVPVAIGTTTTLNFVAGVASTNLRLYRAGAATITVSDGTLSATGTNDLDVTVTAADASRLVITGPANLTAGAVGNLTITATDPYGNTDATYINLHALTFSGASSSTNPVTAPTVENSTGTQVAFGSVTSLNFTAGVSSVSGGVNGELRLFQVGTPVIAVSDGSINASGSDRLSLTVGPASASKLVVTGSATQTAGQTQDISVTAQDPYGNTATALGGNVAVTFAGGGVGGGFNVSSNQPWVTRAGTGAEIDLGSSTTLSFSAGVANTAVDPLQCRLGLVRAGVATITASATTPMLNASTALTVTVNSGPAHHLAIASVNGGADPTAGMAMDVVVEVRDLGDNVVSAGATTGVELSLNHAGTTYPESLIGTLTGTFSASQSSLTISDVVCNQVAAAPFSFSVDDVTSPANPVVLVSGMSAAFDVLNDTPVVTLANVTPMSYVGGSENRVLDPNASAADASSLVPDHFAGGSLVASFSVGAVPSEDVLLIDSSAPIIATGGRVYYNDLGTQIGTYSGGTAGTDLTITLNTNATPDAVDALVKKIAYLNLSGTAPTTTTVRIVLVVLTDGDGAASAAAPRTISLSTGNELPTVVTNTGLTIPRGVSQAITASNLLTTDLDNDAAEITYTLEVAPTQGSIERGGVPVAVNGTFTQAEIDAGAIAYHHAGGSLPSDVFTFSVEDGVNLPTTGLTFSITIQGAAQNPVLSLPAGKLVYVEGAPSPVVMEAGAPFSSTTTITDNFSPFYDNSTLDIEFFDAANAPAGNSGDRISIRNQSPDCPPPILWPGPEDFSTGWVALVGGVVYHRQYPFYYYWANNIVGYPVFSGSFPSPPEVGYPVSWYWGFPLPLDYAIADVDGVLDGTGGKKLRLRLRSGFAPFLGEPLISRSSVARLIANTTFINDSDDPPSGERSLRFTLTVGAPAGTEGVPVGIASRAVEVTPVNDPPSFVAGSLALNLTTLSGIPLNAAVVATDREAAQTRTFSLVSNSQPASGAFTLNSSTGHFTFLPQTAFSGTTTVVIRVTDNLGASTGGGGNPDAVVTITTLSGTTVMQPFVTSDPPLEVEEGAQFVPAVSAYDFSVLTNQTRGPASVTVQLVGDFPAGTALTAGPVATTATPPYTATFTLTSSQPIVRPPSSFYRFGIRVVADYGGGDVEVGYQPITLRVRSLGAPN